MIRQKLQNSVSKEDNKIHNDRNARGIKFSRLTEEEGVMKKPYCGQSIVFLLPTHYVL